MSDLHRLEGDVGEALTEFLNDRLNSGRTFCGLAWSPDMPDDDPNADVLVVDAQGAQYVVEIDVSLTARAPVTTVQLPA